MNARSAKPSLRVADDSGTNSPALTYTIADLAREFDITPRAIRFYEDQGILAPTRAGGGGLRRVYSPRDRTRLKLTLRGKRLGLSLLQIRELIDMYESPKDAAAQARRFLKVLQQHRAALEQQREDIEVTLAEIAQHEAECRRLLGPAPARMARAVRSGAPR
jgi:DNA-binding transcriptional MerR regulator